MAWRVTRDLRLFLNINMAEKPEAHRIQYNALFMSHISWLPDEISEKFKRDFANPYLWNIINVIPTSADTGSTK